MPMKKNTTERKWVDPDDAPHLDRDWFERAEIRENGRLIRPARPVGRPKKNAPNVAAGGGEMGVVCRFVTHTAPPAVESGGDATKRGWWRVGCELRRRSVAGSGLGESPAARWRVVVRL
jgi:hypothetical protein